MEPSSSSHQVVLLPSHSMLLFSLLITILIEKFKNEQPNNVEADENTETLQHHDFSDETAGNDTVEIAPAGSLELGQPSCQTGTSHIPNQLNSRTQVVEEELEGDQITTAQQTEIILSRFVTERMLMQNMAAEAETEAQVQNLKNGLKVSCLVISVSTTGILSFLAGFPRSSQPTMTGKLLFKAGILLMCASLFFALVLVTLSTNKTKSYGLILTVRIIIWISTGLMTLAVVLLVIFYLYGT